MSRSGLPMHTTHDVSHPSMIGTAGPLFVLDGDGRIHDFNAAAARLFAVDSGARDQPLLDVIALTQDRAHSQRELLYALSLCTEGDACSQSVPLLARRGDGAFPATLKLHRERRENGFVPGNERFLAQVHLTSALTASPLLLPLQSLLETLVSGSRDGVLVHDARSSILYANDVAAELLGYESLPDLLAHTAREIWSRWEIVGDGGPVNLTDLPLWLAEQGGLSLESTLRFRRSMPTQCDERWLTVWVGTALGSDAEGVIPARESTAVFLLHDQTGRLQRNHDLVEALAKQQRTAAEVAGVLGQIGEGVVIVDVQCRPTFVNSTARTLLALPPEGSMEALGEILTASELACADPDSCESALACSLETAVFRNETVDGVEWKWSGQAGQPVWIRGTASPLRDAAGLPLGAVLTLRDVTAQRRLMDDLERANRIKDDFLTILSHELRTPLTPLMGWISLLRGQVRAGRDVPADLLEQALNGLETNIVQQKKVIDELLDASSLLLGRARFQLTLYSIVALIRDAITFQEQRVQAKNIQVGLDFDPELPPIKVDIVRLGQAISHVVANAVEFSPVNGLIHISARPVDGTAEVVVRDHGPGIEPEFLPHIFDLFRQGDATFTRRHGGLGLGLTVVKAIVEAHGGAVEVTSAGSGTGTTFKMTLPLDKG